MAAQAAKDGAREPNLDPRELDQEELKWGSYRRPERYDIDCVGLGFNADRPCPYMACENHLGLDVKTEGVVRVNERWDDGRPTCLRDVTKDGHSLTLEEVGGVFGLTRERVRQVEVRALMKLKAEALQDGIDGPAEPLDRGEAAN